MTTFDAYLFTSCIWVTISDPFYLCTVLYNMLVKFLSLYSSQEIVHYFTVNPATPRGNCKMIVLDKLRFFQHTVLYIQCLFQVFMSDP